MLDPEARAERYTRRRNSMFTVIVVAMSLGTVMIGSTVPSGLYTLYERHWGLPVTTTALVFASYIAGVLLALSIFGHLADRINRKAIMWTSLAASLASSGVFIIADSAVDLCVARFITGLSVGLGSGAFTSVLRDICATPRMGSLVSTAVISSALSMGPTPGK